MVCLDGSDEWERTGEVHLEWPCLDQPIQVLHQLCVVHGVVTGHSHVGSHSRFRHPVGISDSPAIAHRPECPLGRVTTLLWDARFSLVTTLLAGFGRAAAEVGTVMIVGGNIEGFTRTMTTAIALETSKGDLPLAVGLGLTLIAVIIAVNALAGGVRRLGEIRAG